jgi:hypothetical protein
MRSRGPLIGIAVVGLAMALPAQAAAKRVCCYRVHVNTSNAIQHEDQGGTSAGAQNGTYSMSAQWEVRELMSYDGKDRLGFLDPVMTRNGREVRGRGRFKGSESSEQWYMDASTTPPTRVDYPPCRYAKDVPWRRGGEVRMHISGGPRFIVVIAGTSEFGAFCDNTSPHLSPLHQWYHPGGGATASGSDDSSWDATLTNINTFHVTPFDKITKLAKRKDLVLTFEPPTITETSQSPAYTATITHRTVIRFTWFPYDRLQKELNELNGLK